jgi:hypothetical protein
MVGRFNPQFKISNLKPRQSGFLNACVLFFLGVVILTNGDLFALHPCDTITPLLYYRVLGGLFSSYHNTIGYGLMIFSIIMLIAVMQSRWRCNTCHFFFVVIPALLLSAIFIANFCIFCLYGAQTLDFSTVFYGGGAAYNWLNFGTGLQKWNK